MPPLVNLSGKRFGRLIVLNRIKNSSPVAKWLCKCDCGTAKIIKGNNLQFGNTISCGCFRKEISSKTHFKHGHAKINGKYGSPEYISWRDMKDRCNNKNNHKYHLYGDRGVTICNRWLKFENFFADMGSRPPMTTLDRYPNKDGNYEPGNVRWATPKQQANNRRKRFMHDFP